MSKILITGANGMLAKAVRKRFKEHELICTDVEELDITNLEQVEKFVEKEKPEYIINCAAFTAVDKAEECYDLAEKIVQKIENDVFMLYQEERETKNNNI